MFRDSLKLLLERDGTNLVVPVATDDECLEAVGRPGGVRAVIFEAGAVPWDVTRLAAELARRVPGTRRVATSSRRTRSGRALDGVTAVRRTASVERFARAVNGDEIDDGGGEIESDELTEAAPAVLSTRELQVLALISGGLTTSLIAERLGISVKTVEGRRQTLFAKLGVQNQSQAVAVAMRAGLLTAVARPIGAR